MTPVLASINFGADLAMARSSREATNFAWI
jgi:hypothetical protein